MGEALTVPCGQGVTPAAGSRGVGVQPPVLSSTAVFMAHTQ